MRTYWSIGNATVQGQVSERAPKARWPGWVSHVRPSEGILPEVLAVEIILFIVRAYSFVSSGATKAELGALIIIFRRDKWYLAKEHFCSRHKHTDLGKEPILTALQFRAWEGRPDMARWVEGVTHASVSELRPEGEKLVQSLL